MIELSPFEIEVIMLSLQISVISCLINAVPAIGMGWLLAKKHFMGKMILDGIVNLPLVLPPVTLGYLLLVVLGRHGWVGSWLSTMGIHFSFSFAGAVVASCLVAFPLVVRSIRVSMEMTPSGLEDVAQTLGASPLKVFCSITLPLSFPGILSGCILGFARSLGEFGATMTFAGNIPQETQTVPLAVYTLMQMPGAEVEAHRLVLFSVMLALVAIAGSEWMMRKAQRGISV
jgi:molybdate transport system permease protein